MVGGKILTRVVGTICPPGKPHSEKFQNLDFLSRPRNGLITHSMLGTRLHNGLITHSMLGTRLHNGNKLLNVELSCRRRFFFPQKK